MQFELKLQVKFAKPSSIQVNSHNSLLIKFSKPLVTESKRSLQVTLTLCSWLEIENLCLLIIYKTWFCFLMVRPVTVINVGRFLNKNLEKCNFHLLL